MHIQSLHLRNYRNLREFSIEFDKNLTVLVANNGAGKTAILDAITVALGTFIGGFPAGTNKGFTQNDAMIRFNPTKDDQERLFPVSLQAMINDNEIRRSLNTNKSKTTNINAQYLKNYATELLQALRDDEDVELPIISYYGTSRLWDGLVRATKKYDKESKSRSYAYHDCLFPESNYKEFKKWFIEKTIAQYKEILKSTVLKKETDSIIKHDSRLLLEVHESLNKALDSVGWYNLYYDLDEEKLLIENKKTRSKLPVDYLSDGVKNMLSVVADIAYRCCKLNPQLEHPCAQTSGIILIDEVDMHLHPSWQQSVIPSLQKIFPQIQLIVTTHSPQVLSSVKQENIRIINPENTMADIPVVNPYGQESMISLEDIMGVKSKPIDIIKDSELTDRYLQIVHNGEFNTEEAKDLRAKIESLYGCAHKSLLLADMIINMWKAKQE